MTTTQFRKGEHLVNVECRGGKYHFSHRHGMVEATTFTSVGYTQQEAIYLAGILRERGYTANDVVELANGQGVTLREASL